MTPTPKSMIEKAAPSAGDDAWFCERGDFWGTGNQLCLCAKCGKSEKKRHDEPRHYVGVFTPHIHHLCDECYDSLPDEEPAQPIDNPAILNEGAARC